MCRVLTISVATAFWSYRRGERNDAVTSRLVRYPCCVDKDVGIGRP